MSDEQMFFIGDRVRPSERCPEGFGDGLVGLGTVVEVRFRVNWSLELVRKAGELMEDGAEEYEEIMKAQELMEKKDGPDAD